MRALLDTQVFLWFLLDDPRLSKPMMDILTDRDAELLFSVASLWEINIKYGLGKLTLPDRPGTYLPMHLDRHEIKLLPIDGAHAYAVADLPPHHRDPFDRMLAAQAQVEGLPIVSADDIFDAYGIRRIA